MEKEENLEIKYQINLEVVKKAEFLEQSENLPQIVVPNQSEALGFTSYQNYMDWRKSSALDPEKLTNILEYQERVKLMGNKITKMCESNSQYSLLYEKLEKIYRSFGNGLQELRELLPKEDQDLEIPKMLKKYSFFLPPRMGSVWFYKHANYVRPFHFIRGLWHIPCPKMGDYDNQLSSIRFMGTVYVRLYSKKNFKGSTLDFDSIPLGGGGYIGVRRLSGFGWNDRTSSYFIWPQGVWTYPF
jgi:hypothetical protein